MKKTLSLSNSTIKKLEAIASEQSTTQSMITETALTIYFLIHYGDPKNAQKITDQVRDAQANGQLDMLDQLFKK